MRKRTKWAVLAISFVAIAVALIYQLAFQRTAKVADYPVQRTIKYSFTVRNPGNQPVKESRLWVYAPVKADVFQQLASLTASHPFQRTKDKQGNERMEFLIDDLPPYASETISVTATVHLSEQGNPIDAIKGESYLNDGELVGLSNPGIQRTAQALKADKPRETADRIFNWITRNIQKAGYTKRDLGALQALKSKSGDCTEFMYLFSALARANGIPTRNMAGFVARENKILRPADFHNWNEAYIDGEWYVVDADQAVFMEKASEYIAMRLLDDATADRTMDAQSFFSASKDIQVSMN